MTCLTLAGIGPSLQWNAVSSTTAQTGLDKQQTVLSALHGTDTMLLCYTTMLGLALGTTPVQLRSSCHTSMQSSHDFFSRICRANGLRQAAQYTTGKSLSWSCFAVNACPADWVLRSCSLQKNAFRTRCWHSLLKRWRPHGPLSWVQVPCEQGIHTLDEEHTWCDSHQVCVCVVQWEAV